MARNFRCEALHGDISQNQREKTLSGFRDGQFNILVATDVAARGLDVPNVDLVSFFSLCGQLFMIVYCLLTYWSLVLINNEFDILKGH